MSVIGKELRHELLGHGDETNPLITIGLSPEILNLGLSNDDLFDFLTKDVARRLVMRFHPDRTAATSITKQYQERFSEAYRSLLNRNTFDLALSDFRSAKAFDRSNTRVYRDAMAELHRTIERKQYQIRELESRLSEAHNRLQESEFAESHIENLRHSLDSLRVEISDNMRTIRKARRLLRRAIAQHDEFRTFLANLCETPRSDHETLDAITWIIAARPLPRRYRNDAQIRNDMIGRSLNLLRTAYEVNEEKIEDITQSLFDTEKSTKVMLGLELLRVSARKIGGELIIGSMPTYDRWTAKHVSLSKMLSATHCHITIGHLLITLRTQSIHKAIRLKQPLNRILSRLILDSGTNQPTASASELLSTESSATR